MADKRRYTVSLPDHVADAVEKQARPLGSTPTEYAADVIRWWFGQGCPPVTHDEAQLRKSKPTAGLEKRVEPLPKNLDVWSIDPLKTYIITDDKVVQRLLTQLGLPNLFSQASEHDQVRFSIAFDNHPTHWLLIDLFKGSDRPDGNGLSFSAFPKVSTSRDEMLSKLQSAAKDMGGSGTFNFSQIPKVPTGAKSSSTTAKVTP